MGYNPSVTRLDSDYKLTAEPAQDDPYSLLAAAIIERAVIDFDRAMHPVGCGKRFAGLRKRRNAERDELVEFFTGDWFAALCSISPSGIMQRAYRKKRLYAMRDFDKLLERRNHRRKPKLESWQKREIDRKRLRRCLKPLYSRRQKDSKGRCFYTLR